MKEAHVAVRLTSADRRAWTQAAKRDGRTLSDWIIRRCNGEPASAPAGRSGQA